MKVLAITQARVGSSRLPKKVLLPLGNDTLLGTHLERLKKAASLDIIFVATTEENESDQIARIANEKGVLYFKGSTNDVLDRFYKAALQHTPEYIVRITSDCPLIDPQLLDKVVESAINGGYDYYTNILVEDFPDGQDIEVMKMSALTHAWQNAAKPSEREHVTPFIRNNCDFNGGDLFKAADHKAPDNYNQVRMTVDEPADLEVMAWLIHSLGVKKSWQEYTDYMLDHPSELKNAKILRNEGYLNSEKEDNKKS